MPPGVATDRRRLQEGIYFIRGKPARACYRLVLLDVEQGTTRRQAREALADVWALLQELRRGVMRDLRPSRAADPDVSVPPGGLTCLLGFGARLFERYPDLVRPAEIRRLDANQPFRAIRAVEADRRPGEACLALQLIADTELAVDRAVVETAMLIAERSLPLQLVTFHDGFNRDDRRSWLGFGDGINNVDPDQRGKVIEVVDANPAWMRGGTYMAFLRMAIDLEAWRRLSRAQQEMRVGRDKLTGCPFVALNGSTPTPLAGCPAGAHGFGSTSYIEAPVPQSFNDLRSSHIHRANQEREGGAEPGDHRIFRQGYEFVEMASGRLRVGLNFVSFQRDLTRLTFILDKPGWLGGANFGGVPEQPLELVTMIAAGFYAVPPAADPFPGAAIF